MTNPDKEHFNAISYIFKYLLKFLDLGLIYNYSGNNFIIKGYIDAN
jgi:hypothetical protein